MSDVEISTSGIRRERWRAIQEMPRRLVSSDLLLIGCLALSIASSAWNARSAEWRLSLFEVPRGGIPEGFSPALTGGGDPPDWQVILAETPALLPPMNPEARTPMEPVLAQLSRDRTDERFPLLVYDEQRFDDFTLRVKMKMVDGEAEQMAGIAFRLIDADNYYVARASAKGNTFRFYRVYRGQRGQIVGPELNIEPNVWHELEIECEGNRIRTRLNGKEAIPEITDPTFREGKIALWTKSDSVSYFSNLRVTYVPQTTLAEDLVADGIAKYDRLLGLQIISTSSKRGDPHVVASSDESDLGRAGTEDEARVIEDAEPMVGKRKGEAVVLLPLRDRNGDPIAAVRVVMKSFPGQTRINAIGRATPVVRRMQARVLSLEDLTR